jgi:predicted ATPase
MSSNEVNSRLIIVTGDARLGKSAIAKTAAMYAFERRIFTDGVVYVDFARVTDFGAIHRSIAAELNVPGVSGKELCRSIDNLHLLIILDNCTSLIESSDDKFREKLTEIVENTRYPKLLVVCR